MFSQKSILIIGLCVFVFIASAFGVYTYNKNKHLNSVSYAVQTTLKALKNKDTKTFAKHVDTIKVAESILSQVFEEPTDEPKKENESFWGSVKALGNSLSERLTDYIKPELINSLNTQIVEYVTKGQFTEKYDLTNLYGTTPMLQKIWHDLAGKEFTFKGVSDIEEAETTANANVNFHRKDLDFSSSLTLNLVKQEDVWRVVGIEGLGKTLKQLDELRIKIFIAKNKAIQSKIDSSLVVRSIEKSTGVTKNNFAGKRVLLRAAFENTGKISIDKLEATITFKNKEGKTLRTVSIEDTDPIMIGDINEKSWPMAINPLSDDDNFIFSASTEELVIESRIHSLTFSNGETLNLIKSKQ